MIDERSPLETVQDAARIDAFVNDETVAAALGRMNGLCYEEFRTAKDDEARRMAQAKALVLEGFLTELRSVVVAGERVVADEAVKARRAPPIRES